MDESEHSDLNISETSDTSSEDKRTDYVLVIDSELNKLRLRKMVKMYIKNLKAIGLDIEICRGKIEGNIYIKIHIPPRTVSHFSYIYGIDIEHRGHNYIPLSSIHLDIASTPLTANRDLFLREGDATTMERIVILNEILSETKFANEENKHGVAKLIRLGAVKTAYPLHDGPYHFDPKSSEPLNDRQLLLKYWANFGMWYKEQPLNLVEKYFGTEIAFYFAWTGFYNMMLIPASVVGVICFVISVTQLIFKEHNFVEEVCNSDLIMCPLCHTGHSCIYESLDSYCSFAKLSTVFDNYATVVFAVFMSFWATLFLNLWTRLENVLKKRWNVENTVEDVKIRVEYKERTHHRRISRITGELEPYTPTLVKIMKFTLSGAVFLLMITIVLLGVLGVILYRLTMTALISVSNLTFVKAHATFLLTCSSGVLQVAFIKLFGKFYARWSEWLAELENPRTQIEYDNSVIFKRYCLGFVNNYAPLFYIAFVKGRFYTPAHKPTLTSFKTDICDPWGCLISLCIQLFFLMTLKSLVGNILTLIVPIITSKFKKLRSRSSAPQEMKQWEEDYALASSGRYLLTTEFMEMIIQYGFVTFFVAAFPLAPLCALINNILELRLDAYKFVKRQRRPIPRQVSGIGSWNHILRAITHLSTATNAFVLAFTSDFVARQIYLYQNAMSLKGYIKSSFSVYDMEDSAEFDVHHHRINSFHFMGNTTLCYYRALRYSASHPKQYQLRPQFWYELGLRLLCVIIFEHVILISNGLFGFFVPDLPKKVKDTMQHDREVDLDFKLKMSQNINRAYRRRRTADMEKLLKKLKEDHLSSKK